ncbi:acyltransferase family protein [Ornithinimicrobium sp. LYQ92]|uniref:acyltransferase family protein n=1 Tax=Serinicoccus sp. LYQ92 TaxID=3378798 RepID=UPI0038548A9D
MPADPDPSEGRDQVSRHPVLSSRYRPELHGLRGLAIALVVLFHVFGDGRVSGGIDVFLAISGFLFTGMLVREVVRTGGPFHLPRYLGRIVRRLLPAAVLVLASTWVAGRLLLPPTRWVQLGHELRASLTYTQNWELIGSQLGYAAAGPGTSPLQHFWSMSVQGQFYLLWPVVVVGCSLLVHRRRHLLLPVLGAMVALVALLSFGWAAWMHTTDQQVAYLHTGTRLWQPALGGLVALLAVEGRLPVRVRVVLGWLGLALVATSGLVLDGGALFPGPAALWPVGGFALVMAAGSTGSRWGVDHWLSGRVLAWVGDRAYPLFLWHWPLVVLGLVVLEQDELTAVTGTAVIAVSVLLAHLTHVLVERPLTRRPMRRPVAVVLVGGLVLGLGAVSLTRWTDRLVDRQQAALAAAAAATGSPEHPGAAAIGEPDLGNTDVADLPTLEAAPLDNASVYDQGCIQDWQDTTAASEVLVCAGTSPGSGPTVLLTGGSHMVHYHPALERIAREQGWNLVVASRSGCHLTTNPGDYPVRTDAPVTDSCARWNANLLEELDEIDPDVVLTLATTAISGQEQVSRGFVEVWQELAARDIDVVAVRDTGRLPERVPECLDEHGDDPGRCGMPRDLRYSETPPYVGAEGIPASVGFVDLIDQICTDTTCPPVVGNVVVYSDHSHLTATYARTLAPELDRQLRQVAPQLYR